MKKQSEEKKEKAPPEKFFARAIDEFFGFHKSRFKDEDGFSLSPSWNNATRGMEMRSLKLILVTLREIAEGKNVEWTEERMVLDFNKFLERAYSKPFVRKNFLCCMMNRYKFDILSSSYNPNLSKKVLEVCYALLPDYTQDKEKDIAAAEIMIGFLKQQYILNSIEFEERSVLQSVKVIISEVQKDNFWNTKSLKSISNNLQEFVNRIKSRNGTNKAYSRQGLASEFNRRYQK